MAEVARSGIPACGAQGLAPLCLCATELGSQHPEYCSSVSPQLGHEEVKKYLPPRTVVLILDSTMLM